MGTQKILYDVITVTLLVSLKTNSLLPQMCAWQREELKCACLYKDKNFVVFSNIHTFSQDYTGIPMSGFPYPMVTLGTNQYTRSTRSSGFSPFPPNSLLLFSTHPAPPCQLLFLNLLAPPCFSLLSLASPCSNQLLTAPHNSPYFSLLPPVPPRSPGFSLFLLWAVIWQLFMCGQLK